MNWLDVNESLMLNLDELRAISKEDGNTTRVFTSESESFVAPIQYETLRGLIKQRKTLETIASETAFKSQLEIQKNLRSLAKGQRTPVP